MDNKIKAAVAEKISEIVKETWKSEKKHLLMSDIGMLLSRSGLSTKAIFEQGEFLPFVESLRDSHDIATRRSSLKPEKIAVFPASAPVPDGEALFETPPPKKTQYSFRAEIWDAFINPIDDGNKRVVNLQDGTCQVDDISSDVQQQTTDSGRNAYIIIDSKYLRNAGSYIPPTEVERRILEWAKQNDVGIDTIVNQSKKDKAEIDRYGALREILSKLNDEERKSLNFRGDVLFKLM